MSLWLSGGKCAAGVSGTAPPLRARAPDAAARCCRHRHHRRRTAPGVASARPPRRGTRAMPEVLPARGPPLPPLSNFSQISLGWVPPEATDGPRGDPEATPVVGIF